jgi:hypothetical protein
MGEMKPIAARVFITLIVLAFGRRIVRQLAR